MRQLGAEADGFKGGRATQLEEGVAFDRRALEGGWLTTPRCCADSASFEESAKPSAKTSL